MGVKYVLKSVVGAIAVDDKGSILGGPTEGLEDVPESVLPAALQSLKTKDNFREFRRKNIEITKEDMKKSVGKDNLVIQTISSIEDLDKVINTLIKHLREWYELYNPEFSRSVHDNQAFAGKIAAGKDQKEKDTMGSDLSDAQVRPMVSLAQRITDLFNLRGQLEDHLEMLMKDLCPNMLELTGSLLGAKLLQQAGSFERLMRMPASTVQVLGAEKAFFRHLKTGSRPPKQGLLIQHPLLAAAKGRGRAARLLAGKISIAVKTDYFKGEFVGDKLKKQVEESLRHAS